VYPKVSVFVVHFNSMKAKDLAKENIKALSQLDYPDYEVIMVDNGSSDHTFEFLHENINDSRFKIIRSDTNTFFGGGNNIAFKYASPESKYFFLVNPDALPYPDSMKKLVELMESDSKLGAIQGKFRTDKGKIDTGRFIADDGGVIRLHSAGIDPNKESLVSYVSGAMMMLRAEFPRRRGFIFYDLPFLYFDSSALGLELYHNGYKVKYFPYETGYHKGKATTENKDSEYYIHISMFMFMLVTNSKFKRFLDMYFYSNYFKEEIRKNISHNPVASPENYRKAYEIAKKYSKRLNLKLDLYSIPHAEAPYLRFFFDMVSAGVRRKFMNDNYKVVIPAEDELPQPKLEVKKIS